MQPNDYFNLIKNITYNNNGDDCNWTIEKIESEKRLILVFQESQGKRDWKNNFAFIPVPVKPYGDMTHEWFCHYGFIHAYKSARKEIVAAMHVRLAEIDESWNVTVIGWSHGGALAQIASEDMFYQFGIKCDVITFGSPCPFYGKKTLDYVKSCVNSAVCYENASDFVTKCPPFGEGMNHTHIGEKFRLSGIFQTGKYHTAYGDAKLYE